MTPFTPPLPHSEVRCAQKTWYCPFGCSLPNRRVGGGGVSEGGEGEEGEEGEGEEEWEGERAAGGGRVV